MSAESEFEKRLRRIAALVVKQSELLAQLHDVQREIENLSNGRDAIGDVLKRLEACFSAEWQSIYDAKYSWDYTKDRPHWKRFLKLTTEADIIARIMAFFHAQRDDFAQRNGHRFGIFVSQFNTLAAAVPREMELTAPTHCTHRPPCKSDVEHTRRVQAEMRGGQR